MKNKKMKMARLSLDMSQEMLAAKVDVTRQTIGMIEAGKFNPSLKIMHCHLQGSACNIRRTILGGG